MAIRRLSPATTSYGEPVVAGADRFTGSGGGRRRFRVFRVGGRNRQVEDSAGSVSGAMTPSARAFQARIYRQRHIHPRWTPGIRRLRRAPAVSSGGCGESRRGVHRPARRPTASSVTIDSRSAVRRSHAFARGRGGGALSGRVFVHLLVAGGSGSLRHPHRLRRGDSTGSGSAQ